MGSGLWKSGWFFYCLSSIFNLSSTRIPELPNARIPEFPRIIGVQNSGGGVYQTQNAKWKNQRKSKQANN